MHIAGFFGQMKIGLLTISLLTIGLLKLGLLGGHQNFILKNKFLLLKKHNILHFFIIKNPLILVINNFITY